MEHRYSKRLQAGVDARIFKRGQLVAEGIVRDVSRRGLFVETDFQGVGVNQSLEVEVQAPAAHQPDGYRFHMVVTRRTLEGLGLEFSGADEGRHDSLRLWLEELMAATQQQRHRAEARR